MRDPNFIDEQRNADLLDAMADRDHELREAMTEADPGEFYGWDGEEEISPEERFACEMYNERYVFPYHD